MRNISAADFTEAGVIRGLYDGSPKTYGDVTVELVSANASTGAQRPAALQAIHPETRRRLPAARKLLLLTHIF